MQGPFLFIEDWLEGVNIWFWFRGLQIPCFVVWIANPDQRAFCICRGPFLVE